MNIDSPIIVIEDLESASEQMVVGESVELVAVEEPLPSVKATTPKHPITALVAFTAIPYLILQGAPFDRLIERTS